MKRNIKLLLLLWLLLPFKLYAQKSKLSVATILKTFESYYAYEYTYVKLSEAYLAYDVSGHLIPRIKFLQLLASGQYLPLTLSPPDHIHRYQLYRLPATTDYGIQARLKQLGEQYLQYAQMEGHPLPNYYFVDLNGKKYNSTNTHGKIIVLKCWFIHCLVCVQEMPVLNKLVSEYKNKPDVIFLSLAFDNKRELSAFLKKTDFRYSVVPNEENYLIKKLKIDAYPTHLIIDRQGKVYKVLENAEDLIVALHKMVPM